MDSIILGSVTLAQSFDHTFLIVVKFGCIGVAIAILAFGIIEHRTDDEC
jgi:hypothetical protein